ncbi:MAG TPA: TMEM175 family protein [Anaeromyxobacter sp.]|nr:TMEM175 family protein [Anaeromyxobacter sp.]
MTKTRLEAFSDGVIAIIITILVLELKVPRGAELAALRPLLPVFLTYVLSFVLLGIYWVNHHHLLHATTRIDGRILWANLHLLFWLSLVPFVTGWMGEHHSAAAPGAAYGAVMLAAAIAYTLLSRAIVAREGRGSRLAAALGRDVKGKVSLAMYAAAIPLAFVSQWLSDGIFVAVALVWLVPDRRIEARLAKD